MSLALSTTRSPLKLFEKLYISRSTSCLQLQHFQSRSFKAKGPIPPTQLDSFNDSECPPYPYGAKKWFKQADRGLYGGKIRISGFKISDGRNEGKTRRIWMPNVRLETLKSEALGTEVTIRVTAACMRTIEKCGGLDAYLMGTKPARIKELGMLGWKMRWKVMQERKKPRAQIMWRTLKSFMAHKTVELGRIDGPKFQAKYMAKLEAKLEVPEIKAALKSNTPFVKAWENPKIRAILTTENTFEQAWADLKRRTELVEEQKKAHLELQKKDARWIELMNHAWRDKKNGEERENRKLRPIIPEFRAPRAIIEN